MVGVQMSAANMTFLANVVVALKDLLAPLCIGRALSDSLVFLGYALVAIICGAKVRAELSFGFTISLHRKVGVAFETGPCNSFPA